MRITDSLVCAVQIILESLDIREVSCHDLSDLLGIKYRQVGVIMSYLGWERINRVPTIYRCAGHRKEFSPSCKGYGRKIARSYLEALA